MNVTVSCIGDLLVEIMRKNVGDPLDKPGIFLGPYPSGASGIFIDAISRLGINTCFIGTVGKDDFGKLIIERLKKDGVNISNIKETEDYTTGVAFVTYFEDGSRKFIYHLANAATGQIYPEDINSENISNSDYLHIVGSTISINKNCRKSIEKAIKIIDKFKVKITFDPNLRPELLRNQSIKSLFSLIITKSYIVFPTQQELEVLTGEKNLEKAAQKLLGLGPEIIAIKQGKKGSIIYTDDDNFHSPPFKVKEVDSTGAGDCYCAGFISAIIKGMDLKNAARFANAVGALAVTKKGPMEGAPTIEEVNNFMSKF